MTTGGAYVSGVNWLNLPAVPESRLDDALRARLAAGEGGPPAPPPWTTSVSAVLWWHRAAPDAAQRLPDAVRDLPHLPITVGALVRYRNSPVGSYSEVFASPVLLRRGRGLPAVSVPFIAVDSLASVVGGRAGWMLPKTLARALWPPDDAARIETDDWSVAVSIAPRGPRVPIRGRLPLLQSQPEGGRRLSLVQMRGRMQVGWARVDTSGPSLPSWLRSGRHPAVAISSGTMRISAPGDVSD
jgi:hypothetical protein